MRREFQSQSMGLIEVFRREPVPMAVTAGQGGQPPRIRTALGMAEPEENKRPIPFVFWDAVENNGELKESADTTFEDADERAFHRLFALLEPNDLPGLDDTLRLLDDLVEPQTPAELKLGFEKLMLRAYDEGNPLFRPKGIIGRITQPIEYALMRRRVNKATRVSGNR